MKTTRCAAHAVRSAMVRFVTDRVASRLVESARDLALVAARSGRGNRWPVEGGAMKTTVALPTLSGPRWFGSSPPRVASRLVESARDLALVAGCSLLEATGGLWRTPR